MNPKNMHLENCAAGLTLNIWTTTDDGLWCWNRTTHRIKCYSRAETLLVSSSLLPPLPSCVCFSPVHHTHQFGHVAVVDHRRDLHLQSCPGPAGGTSLCSRATGAALSPAVTGCGCPGPGYCCCVSSGSWCWRWCWESTYPTTPAVDMWTACHLQIWLKTG